VTVAAAGWLGAASVLLLAAGAGKAVDPTRTAGALAALGWPSSPAVVRAGAVAEAGLGALGLVVGGTVVAALVAVSFAGFTVFVAAALLSGTPVGTCGCFARDDTPPRPLHVAVDALLAGGAALAAATDPVALVDAPAAAWPLAALVAVAAYAALTRPSRSVSAQVGSGD
jgi:hypothetical protein